MSKFINCLKCAAKTGVLVAAVAGLLCTAGCAGRMVSGTIEERIESSLPELIGPAKSYHVRVSGSALKMAKGKFSEVDIHGEDVSLSPGLMVGALNVKMKDVVVNPGSRTLKSVGETVFDAAVSEDSLNQYLSKSRSDGMRVKVEDGLMTVWAEPKLLRISVGVKLDGRVVPQGSALLFRIDRLQVIGVNAPSIAERMIEDRINPVMDLNYLQFTPEIGSVEMGQGIIRIKGTARLKADGRAL